MNPSSCSGMAFPCMIFFLSKSITGVIEEHLLLHYTSYGDRKQLLDEFLVIGVISRLRYMQLVLAKANSTFLYSQTK